MTFQRKLAVLVGSSIAITLLISWIGFKEALVLKSALSESTEVDLPSVRTVTLVDMLHDSLKGLVYQTIYANMSDDKDALASVKKEFEAWSADFEERFKKLSELKLEDEIKIQIDKSYKAMKLYQAEAARVIELGQGARKSDWSKDLASFEEQFSALEVELEKLGEQIETLAGEHSTRAKEQAQFYGTIQWIGNIAGLLMMMLLSSLIGRSMIKVLVSSVGELNHGSEVLGTLSHKVNESSQSLSASVDEQSSAVQETAASMEEISAMVRKTSENSNQLVRISKENEGVTEAGKRAAGDMLNSIDALGTSYRNIADHISHTNQKISEIQEVISAIDAKTKVINDIVFQTKILAFNASVEAARAGENGKGFAVVAEEVGNLAQMSGVASKEITSILESAANSVRGIVEESKVKAQQITQEATGRLQDSTKAAEECGFSLEKISKNAEKIALYTEEMSQAISEQAKGVEEINKAITIFSQTSQSSSQVARTGLNATSEISSEVEKLIGLAGGLKSLVDSDKLKAA